MNQRSIVVFATTLLLGLAVHAPGQMHEPDPEAMDAFKAMVDAYRARPSLGVHTVVTIEMGEGDLASAGPEVEATFIFDSARRGILELRGYTCYLADGTISAIHEETDHAFYSIEDDGSPYYALMTNLFYDLPFPHLALAFGESDVSDVIMQFHQKAPWIQPTALRTDLHDDVTVQVITLTSDYDKMEIFIDPDTKLMQLVELEVTGGAFVQEGSTLRYRHEFEYDVRDDPLADDDVVFSPGDRQQVDMLASLQPAPKPPAAGGVQGGGEGALVGKPAPAFILESLEGEVIDLEDLQGQVVIIDFWASWCGPCMRALPMLHQAAAWAEDENLPVKVYTINTFEGRQPDQDTPEGRRGIAAATWEKQGFTLPVLMDYTDETAAMYGVTGIPSTIIIGPDGTVSAQHTGAGPNYFEQIKADITAALEEAGDDD